MLKHWFLLYLILLGCAQQKTIPLNDFVTVTTKPISEDNCENGLDNWHVEQMPGVKVENNDGKLEITDTKGCTTGQRKHLKDLL